MLFSAGSIKCPSPHIIILNLCGLFDNLVNFYHILRLDVHCKAPRKDEFCSQVKEAMWDRFSILNWHRSEAWGAGSMISGYPGEGQEPPLNQMTVGKETLRLLMHGLEKSGVTFLQHRAGRASAFLGKLLFAWLKKDGLDMSTFFF